MTAPTPREKSHRAMRRLAWLGPGLGFAAALWLWPGTQAPTAVAASATGARPMAKDVQAVGGTDVAKGTALWHVAIIDANRALVDGPMCGGTFLNSRFVLTAAHCFVDEKTCAVKHTAATIVVAFGGVDLRKGMQLVGAQDVLYPKPSFDCGKSRANDIAIVELQEAATGVIGVGLPPASAESEVVAGGQRLAVTGWGRTQEAGAISHILQAVQVPQVPVSQCNSAAQYAGRVPPGAICAGESGKDACNGDSGGPLFALSGSGVVQYGIVSQGEGCGKRDRPSIYTRVDDHIAWIQASMHTPCTKQMMEKGIC